MFCYSTLQRIPRNSADGRKKSYGPQPRERLSSQSFPKLCHFLHLTTRPKGRSEARKRGKYLTCTSDLGNSFGCHLETMCDGKLHYVLSQQHISGTLGCIPQGPFSFNDMTIFAGDLIWGLRYCDCTWGWLLLAF